MIQKDSFKRSKIGLDSAFSFSRIGCHTKIKETSQSYYLPIGRGEERGSFFMTLAQSETQSRPGFELKTPITFLTSITVTLSTPV